MAQRGNPGYGKSVAVRQGVEKLTPRYFEMIEEMLNAKLEDSVNDNVKELVKALIPQDSYAAKEIIRYLARGAMEDRKFALSELGKLMGKMLPTEITGEGGNALMITWQQPQTSLQSHTLPENGSNNSITPESDGLSSSSTGEQERLPQSSITSSETLLSPQTPDTLS